MVVSMSESYRRLGGKPGVFERFVGGKPGACGLGRFSETECAFAGDDNHRIARWVLPLLEHVSQPRAV